jgi:hypothetical protein
MMGFYEIKISKITTRGWISKRWGLGVDDL